MSTGVDYLEGLPVKKVNGAAHIRKREDVIGDLRILVSKHDVR